ncbi:GNAT family N-acetyltransferase [Flexibacterium corallicola]|uniref:GNAT family N-acetyltransferase n=1 Tax=Flexibacterium corallicola TaxID=3037259 RepID=UPI00286F2D5C|nr:GNAT family N-acetyltransferase [Pseudovibrio sp. M1P-2-3]
MSTELNPLDVSIRPARAGDEGILELIHRDERHWEFSSLKNFGQEELYHSVLSQQYTAQHNVYFNQYDLANYGLILWCEAPVGRVYLAEDEHMLKVLDLSLLQKFQRRGIGTVVMKGICAKASKLKIPVMLHVLNMNRPAYKFYYRFGFEPETTGRHHTLMRWYQPDYDALLRGEFISAAVKIKRMNTSVTSTPFRQQQESDQSISDSQ